MTKHQYIMHTDPGHGWLEVPFSELVELRLVNRISHYSYADLRIGGAVVFLEEDCDYARFADAWESKFGYDFSAFVVEAYADPSFVRDLPNYMPSTH